MSIPTTNPHAPGQLILLREELGPQSDGRRPLAAGATAIYATRSNSYVQVGRALYAMEHRMRGYRVRFDVSLADHEFNSVDVSAWLTSLRDEVRFSGKINFGFRVVNPVEIVQRNIVNGYQRVLSRLQTRLVSISSTYDVEQYAAVQAEMNRLTDRGPIDIGDGIQIYHFFAQIVRDTAALDAGLKARMATQAVKVARAEHELARVVQQGERVLERQEMDALQTALSGNLGPLLLVLTRNKDRVYDIFKEISASRTASRQQGLDLLKQLIDNDLLQDVDVEVIREQLLRTSEDATRFGAGGLDEILSGHPMPQLTAGGQPDVTGTLVPPNAQQPAIPQQPAGPAQAAPAAAGAHAAPDPTTPANGSGPSDDGSHVTNWAPRGQSGSAS
ncbi:MAG: hypothetical protein HOV77_24005 [Hamadaea sp.]|uniref:hypothetical protein n=1 Tax=Hamadaea sp. TaxID=2024425 RepID=UPI0017957047|nr:hypothetical protein [Hamadaea sp.]NUT22249.1 hypothetical protein [Hamadaea sp.]